LELASVRPNAQTYILVLDDDDGSAAFRARARRLWLHGGDTGNGEKAMEILMRRPPFDLLLAECGPPINSKKTVQKSPAEVGSVCCVLGQRSAGLRQ
jgi:L-ascorbate metabolism protein UlaG (beta-lactamase superfamily)